MNQRTNLGAWDAASHAGEGRGSPWLRVAARAHKLSSMSHWPCEVNVLQAYCKTWAGRRMGSSHWNAYGELDVATDNNITAQSSSSADLGGRQMRMPQMARIAGFGGKWDDF